MKGIELKAEYLNTLEALLYKYVPQAEAWAYGSRVNGEGHEASDLDIVLRNPADIKTPLPGIVDLKEAITESNLPILVDVMDWARLPEALRLEIERKHIVLRKA